MARQESQSKLLYYPTPLSVVKLIATWLSAPVAQLTRLVDPCAGEGDALHTLAQTFPNAETWGIELSYARAEKATRLLHRLLPTSFYTVSWSPASASLIFNNPPYDWSDQVDDKGRRLRHEALFVKGCTPRLVTGGVQVVIIPQGMLGDEALARHWLGWYDQTRLWRFPDGDYDAFKQIVLIGVKHAAYVPPKDSAVEAFTAQAHVELPPLQTCDGAPYALPPAPEHARFEYLAWSDDALARLGAQANPLGQPEWQRVVQVAPLGAPIRPLLPIKVGHLSMLISAGELGVVRLPYQGQPALLKGTLMKTRVVSTETKEEEHGTVTTGEEREQLHSVLTLLRGDGMVETFTTPDQVAQFITEQGGLLADAVLEKNAPFYAWHPTATEWRVANHTAQNLPPLPGRTERGLFEVQKHFAIAAARAMRAQHHVILNCDMGFGKTATTIAALEQRDRWPALVICPGHMVDKWRRDLELASNPEEPITARIITRPVRAEASWLAMRVLPLLEKHHAVLLRDERWQVSPVASNDTGLRRRLTVQGGNETLRRALHRLVLVRAQRPDELNPVGAPTQRPSVHLTTDGFALEFFDRDDYTLADFFADYEAGRLGRKAVAIVGFDPAKYDAGVQPIPLPERTFRIWETEAEQWRTVRAPCCPQCGQPFGVQTVEGRLIVSGTLCAPRRGQVLPVIVPHIPDVCPHTEAVPLRDTNGVLLRDERGALRFALRRCGARLYEMSRWRRVGVSRLVQRHYRHRFQVYVADEVHEAQNGHSDIGACDGRLTGAIRDSLALTGTLFGGTASSLFYLLFRRNAHVRQRYAYTDVATWIDHFGLWKFRWMEFETSDTRGASTGIRRLDRTPDELPGVSPAVIRYLLPCTLFGKITDLGYALPPLTDQVRTVAMGKDLHKHYTDMSERLLKKAMQALKDDRDPGLLSVWFTTCRYRPMSAFRPEVVTYKDAPLLELPTIAVDGRLLPKEDKLIELVTRQRAQGRKTLVFVEQTGTRDIRERLRQLLRERVPGINVLALSANDLKPAQREAWIRRHAPTLDVLLVNAGLVKTGLDLVMFSDIVFYETNVSLYTVWQSMRRVWRLGQARPVTTTFLAYDGALEAALLDNMGAKMKSAMLLYGDNAAGALVDSDGEDDVAREMIRRALTGKAFTQIADLNLNGRSLFGSETVKAVPISDSPVGTPVAASPVLPVLATDMVNTLLQLGLFGDAVTPRTTRRRRR